jgi:hypothetical protein
MNQQMVAKLAKAHDRLMAKLGMNGRMMGSLMAQPRKANYAKINHHLHGIVTALQSGARASAIH